MKDYLQGKHRKIGRHRYAYGPVRVYLSLRSVLVLQAILFAAAIVVTIFELWNMRWLYPAAMLALLILVSIQYQRRSSLQWLGLFFRWLLGYRRSDEFLRSKKPLDIIDVRSSTDHAEIGVLWERGVAVTALSVTVSEDSSPSSAAVPLSLHQIADSLWQYDILLTGIDAISLTKRATRGVNQQNGNRPGDVLAAAEALQGGTTCERELWLVLRTANWNENTGVHWRGGGRAGTVKAAVSASRRLAQRLSEAGIESAVASSSHIRGLYSDLAISPGRWNGTSVLRTKRPPAGIATAYVSDLADDVTESRIAEWLNLPSHLAVSTVRMTPARERHHVFVQSWVSYVLASRIKRRPQGLRGACLRKQDVFLANLPLGSTSLAAGHRIEPTPKSPVASSALEGIYIPL